jgi:hypothetical protein
MRHSPRFEIFLFFDSADLTVEIRDIWGRSQGNKRAFSEIIVWRLLANRRSPLNATKFNVSKKSMLK